MLFDGRLVETVKNTHYGTFFTNRQWQWAPEVNKGTFDAEKCRQLMPCSTDVNKNERTYISNAKVICAKSTVVDNGQVFVVLCRRKVVTCSVYC